jgi:preprotein translocase subunit SecE
MNILKKFTQFLSEAKGELKKVSWPSRAELMNSTMIVIVSVIILAIYIGIVDIVLSKLVGFIIR